LVHPGFTKWLKLVSSKISSKMKATISYFPNEDKKSPRTGRVPIYLRVSFNRQKAETRLNADVSESQLLKWDPHTMRFADRSLYGNHMLNKLDERFHEFLVAHSLDLHRFPAAEIRDHIIGKPNGVEKSVLQYIDKYYKNAVESNLKLSPGTIKNYRKAIVHFRKFLVHKKLERLTLSGLNNAVALGFKDYLLSSVPDIKKSAMTEPSAAGIIKKFRTIFSRAVDKQLLQQNVFKVVKLKVKSPVRQRLNIDQVRALATLDLAVLPTLQLYLDIFMFSVLSGLAYHDSMFLRSTDLGRRTDGVVRLTL
jgi:hypothetical protein